MRERERDASERERGFCERSRPERKRTAGGGSSSHSSSVLLVFSDFLSSCLFYFLSRKPFSFLLLFTRYVPASIYRALLFLPYSSERRTPLLLYPSTKRCSRSISSRVFCEFLRSRRVFSGAISRDKSDGRRINIHQRERKKKRFWRQCPILNPMTAR